MNAMHWKKREGFSLVELAIVLVIAGLILAICTPGVIRYLNGQRVRDSARLLADEMRLARQLAVSNSTRNWVYTQWSANANQYLLGTQTQNPNGTWNTTQWRGPFELPSKTKQIGANFNAFQYFYYDPNGRPSGSGSVRVISTIPSVTDTATVNLDLSGSVW
jgi:prepilin-type N-terminal cleavage/methylation domain-containing protein